MKYIHRFWLWLTKPAELIDWLGEGVKSVTESEAMRRSEICLSCPLNRRGSFIVETSALVIKRKLGLTVPKENYLEICQACGCSIKLKIWVNYEHIKAWQKQAVADEIRKVEPNCWQL